MSKRSLEREDFLATVVVTATEGGINYWAQVTGYKWFSPLLDGGSHEPTAQGGANATVTFTVPDNEDPDEVHTGGIGEIASALAKIRDTSRDIKYLDPGWRKTIIAADAMNDGGDIDSVAADIIVQIAAFGEVVFG